MFGRRGTLSSSAGITPDTVAEIGYYISGPAVTRQYTGVPEYALFLNTMTSGNAGFVQTFITKSGRVFSRYPSEDGTFREAYALRAHTGVAFSASSVKTTAASDSKGGLIYIYFPYGGGKYIRVALIHGTRKDWEESESLSYRSEDVYRPDTGIVGTLSADGTFTAEFELITPGAWDGACYEGFSTASGIPSGNAFGTFHGWEKFSRCLIQVDGQTVADLAPGDTLPDLDFRYCEGVDVFYWADIYRPGTSTVIAKTYKRYTAAKGGIHAFTRYQWQDAGDRAVYAAMGCVSRALTDHVVCDYDYEMHDVSDSAVTPVSPSGQNKPGVSRCVEFGLETQAKCEITIDPPVHMYVQNNLDSSYNKLYFNHHGTVAQDEVWAFDIDFRFGGGVKG